MIVRSLAVILSCALASSVHALEEFKKATPDELAMKSVALAPGAPAVILDWIQENDDTNFHSSEYLRIKILTEEGKKYGDIEIPYVVQFMDLHHIKARMTKPDGTIVPFNGKMYDKLLVKTSGIRVMVKTFTFPDVQPGCILEYRYDLGMRVRLLRDTVFTFQRELPVLHASLRLRPYERHYSSFFSYQGLPEGKHPLRVGDHFELDLENIPAFDNEMYAPPDVEIKPRVNFFYIVGRMLDPEPFWANEGKSWTSTIEKFIGNNRFVKEQADAAIADAPTPEAKLRLLYVRAQQIRNLAHEEEKTPAEAKKLRDNNNAEDVLRNGYGYSAEISRTFAALARAAGFEANQARIAERDDGYFARKVPIGSQLDGELTVVTIDGKQRYFDAGTPGAPFGILAWQKSDVPGLLVMKKSPAIWVQTPEQMPSEARLVRNAALRIEDGAVKGNVTVNYHGHEALLRRVKNHNDDEEAARKSFEETAKQWFPEAASIKVATLTGLKSIDDPIVVELEVELPSLASFAGARVLIPMSVFGASAKNPFAAAQRKHPIVFSNAWAEWDDVTLQVPDGYFIESLPKDVKWDSGPASYNMHYASLDGGKRVHLTRRFQVHARFFDTDAYPALRNFFSRVTAADQEQLVLKTAAKAVAK